MPQDDLQNKTNNSVPFPPTNPDVPMVNSQSLQPNEDKVKENSQELKNPAATAPISPSIIASGLSQNSTKPLKKSRKKLIITIISFLLLISGIGAGVFLSQQSQEIREKAAEVESPIPTSPSTQTNSSTNPAEITCLGIKAYSLDWSSLDDKDLSQLKAGDTIYLTISGKSELQTKPVDQQFTQARFKVNSEKVIETTQKREGATGREEFYIQYTIPEKITNFTVQGAIYHKDYGWIGDLNSTQ